MSKVSEYDRLRQELLKRSKPDDPLFTAAEQAIRELSTWVDQQIKLNVECEEAFRPLVEMRTHFTGEFPYYGWRGITKAFNEILDERDVYRATLEEILETKDYLLMRVAHEMARTAFKLVPKGLRKRVPKDPLPS